MKPTFGDDITYAIKYGTTMSFRLFLCMASLMQAAAYFLQAPGWWSAPVFVAMHQVFPLHYWGFLYLTAGLLGAWRMLSPHSRPLWAYIINSYVLAVWSAGWIVRMLLGWTSVFSICTMVVLFAFWVLVRTEATHRDSRTA